MVLPPDRPLDTDRLANLRRELVRLRSGRALADPTAVLRLNEGFWSAVAPSGTGDLDQATRIELATTQLRSALDALNPALRPYAAVELNLDKRFTDADLGDRQHAHGQALGVSVKTVRRYGDIALRALALNMLTAHSRPASARVQPATGVVGAEDTAMVRRFWGIGSGQGVDVVCSVLTDKLMPDHARQHNPNYVRYAKFADLDSIVYLRIRIAELFPGCHVRDFSASEYDDYNTDHLLVLGGPDYNSRAKHFDDLVPYTVSWSDDRAAGFLRTEKEELSPGWSPTRSLQYDYATFTRLRFRNGLTVNLIAGVCTYGVLGAAHCYLDPVVAVHNIRFTESLVGRHRSFAVVARVNNVGGIVQPPFLADDCVALYGVKSEFSTEFVRVAL